MHAVRSAARPKLSLTVPAAGPKATPLSLAIPAAASGFSRPAALPSPSPLTPTARNTMLNARGASSLQVPVVARGAKKAGKKVAFAEDNRVELVSPCPREYYGEYVKMSRDERRWGRK